MGITHYMHSRAARVAAFVAVGVALVALLPLVANTREAARPSTRSLELIAREMSFVLAGSDVRNPILRVRAGEQVRLVLRNSEPGMLHDFAIPALNVAMEALRANQSGYVTFRAPAVTGRYEYLCRPHAIMMKGILEVTD